LWETRPNKAPVKNRHRLGGWAPFERYLQKENYGSSILKSVYVRETKEVKARRPSGYEPEYESHKQLI
jgi:hypothetical protein